MTAETLTQLLTQPEGIKLDFKREYYLSKPDTGVSNPADWKKLTIGQWDELIKDVLALTNGNVGTAQQPAYLIMGVDDALDANGVRNVYGASHIKLSAQQLMAKVNDACEPPISDLTLEAFQVNGKEVKVIEIPPSAHVHETTRDLVVQKGNIDGQGNLLSLHPSKNYTQFTTFVRNGEAIFPASSALRRALEEDKGFRLAAMDDNLRFELTNNLMQMVMKPSSGQLCPTSVFYSRLRRKTELRLNENLILARSDVAPLLWACLYATGCEPKLSTQFLDTAISSGTYLTYNFSQGRYERSLFLQRLHELQSNTHFFRKALSNFNFGEFGAKYLEPHKTTGTVVVQFFDAVQVMGLLARHENIITLSIALLSFLLGNEASIEDLRLNPASPVAPVISPTEDTPTESELLDWISSGAL